MKKPASPFQQPVPDSVASSRSITSSISYKTDRTLACFRLCERNYQILNDPNGPLAPFIKASSKNVSSYGAFAGYVEFEG